MRIGKYGFAALATGLLASWLTVACNEKPPTKTREQVMQEKLTERLDRWKLDMRRKCLRNIVEKAIAYVDSIVLVNARSNRDTSVLPYIPGRPMRPDFKAPEDTTPVKPILPDSLQR